MATLKEILLSDNNRLNVVQGTTLLIDEEVGRKSGLSGLAIKGAYKAVKSVKPTLVFEAVDGLLDRFVDKLEPLYAKWEEGGKTPAFDAFLDARKQEAANALLSVTDERIDRADNAVVKKAYKSLRPQGEKNVQAAIPGLGRLVSQYLS